MRIAPAERTGPGPVVAAVWKKSMRMLAAVLALASVLAATGNDAASSTERAPLLGAVWAGGGELVLLDPFTLQPVRRSGVRLAGGWSTARSGDGSLIAAASGSTLHLLDARTLTVLRSQRVENRLAVSAWPRPGRLITAPSWSQTGSAVVLDPLSGRIVARRPLPGVPLAMTATRNAVVVLLGRRDAIEVLTLVVVAADGDVRSVRLPGVRGGFRPPGPGGPAALQTQPGLAVDQTGRRAVVVTPTALTDVDLNTLSVRQRSLAPRRPASLQKTLSGWSRAALWVTPAILAITGTNYTPSGGQGRHEQAPAGLLLADTRSWRVRLVEPEASEATLADRTLVATGLRCGSGPERCRGIGLRGYTPTGRLRFHLFGSEPLADVRVAGSLAYLSDCNSFCYRIVDTTRGRLLTTVRTRQQTVLAR